MKKKVTRAELEAIGENWFQRRNKLLDVAHNEMQPHNKRLRAFCLAAVMNIRIGRISVLLGQQKALNGSEFPPGGFVYKSPGEDGAEYLIK